VMKKFPARSVLSGSCLYASYSRSSFWSKCAGVVISKKPSIGMEWLSPNINWLPTPHLHLLGARAHRLLTRLGK
jgi:hypothetical protein